MKRKIAGVENKKAGIKPAFLINANDYSATTGSVVGSGRSTNSTNAIGALSPLRKPHFKIRK